MTYILKVSVKKTHTIVHEILCKFFFQIHATTYENVKKKILQKYCQYCLALDFNLQLNPLQCYHLVAFQ